MQRLDIKHLRQKALEQGLVFIECTPYHMKVSGRYEVNVYPTTGRVHIKGDTKAGKFARVEQIISFAQGEDSPEVPIVRRKSMGTSKEVLWRKSHSCGICGNLIASIDEATVDHIRPRAVGGSNRLDNLQLAHEQCNFDKADRLK